MAETIMNATDQPLAVLLQAERDFPGSSLDFCSGYVSTNGVLLIKSGRSKSSERASCVQRLNRRFEDFIYQIF